MYDNDDDFVDRVTSFLGAGTEAGEAGLAVLSRHKWGLLCEALDDSSQRILYLERDSLYTRPLGALAEYDALLRRALEEGAPAVRLMGELPVSEAREQCEAWMLYEAVINHAFADRPISIFCGYDVREHPAATIEAAWHTHPRVLVGGWEDNPRYEDPEHVAGVLTGQPEPLDDLRELPLDDDVEAFSARLREELVQLHVRGIQAQNLVRAAREVFDNAGTHGLGARSQRIGRVAGRIVWELSDNGPGFENPLAGYLPPLHEDADGQGLWVARRLTHRVEFVRSPRGFTTRLWI